MNKSILFRYSIDEEDEYRVCSSILPTVKYRSEISSNTEVWARYSALPYFEELQEELRLKSSYLINSYEQHLYVADIENYYQDIKDYTPKTYFNWYNLNEGEFVVKGRTNSRKHEWKQKMFARGREELLRVISRLLDDHFIGEQRLCVREYIPLVEYGKGINDLPFTNEWRLFFYGEKLISYGYYWTNWDGYRPADLDPVGLSLATRVASIVKDYINFFVIDIAETKAGEWIVIELNDGMCSGLSENDPEKLYRRIKEIW